MGKAIQHHFLNLPQILYTCSHRFIKEHCSIKAAGLTFYTIFSLVPLAALALGLIGAISIIHNEETRIHTFFIHHFVPPFTAEIEHDIRLFIEASGKLSRASSIVFLLSAIFLIGSIESCFNQIWKKRNQHVYLMRRIFHYGMVLIVSPIFLGLSVALSAVLLSTGWIIHQPILLSGLQRAIELLPFVLTWLGIAVLYYWLPHTHVKLKHALYASFWVAVLFEIMKYLLKLYIVLFPTYQLVYGALSVLLIFFLWIYFSWMIVLWGAIFTSELDESP